MKKKKNGGKGDLGLFSLNGDGQNWKETILQMIKSSHCSDYSLVPQLNVADHNKTKTKINSIFIYAFHMCEISNIASAFI